MEAKQRLILTLTLGIILVFGFYFITNSITKHTGFVISENLDNKETDFSKCLKEQDITIYVNTNSLAGTLKNIELVEYLENVNIMNCLRDNLYCLDKRVTSFPSWEINSQKINKDINLEELSELSGCRLVN